MTGESVERYCYHEWHPLDAQEHHQPDEADNEWDGSLAIVWYCITCRTLEREERIPFERGQVVESA